MMLHRKPATSILPPLTYRGAEHRDESHPANLDAKLLFEDGGEWWLDLCRLHDTPSPPVSIQDGERYCGRTVYPDGSIFEWNGVAYEVMGHDRAGARLWIREVSADLDLPTTEEPEPELRRSKWRKP